MTNLKDITKFLKEVSAIREFDLETSFINTPDAKRLRDEKLKDEVTKLLDIYPNLKSPEKEYLESLKNFYELSDKKTKFDYSEIEKGKTSLDTPITQFFDNCDMTVRTYDCLRVNEIEYLGELVQSKEKNLLRVRNFGKKSLKEVNTLVTKEGYSLEMNIDYVRPENRK